MMSRSDWLSQPPRAREPNRMAQSTGASATRSRQRAIAAGSGSGWWTAGIWSPMRCRFTGGIALSCRWESGGIAVRF